MKQYQLQVYNTAFYITQSKDDAEDIAQETFLQVLEKIEQWRGENFTGWLLTITRNLAIDCVRKRRKEKHKAPINQLEVLDDPTIKSEQKEIINRILRQLPYKQREILYLKHFQGLTIREIALKRNCAEGTIKATLSQVFSKLKDQFKRAGLME